MSYLVFSDNSCYKLLTFSNNLFIHELLIFQFLLLKKNRDQSTIILQIQIYYYLQNKSYRDKTEKSTIAQATLRRNLKLFWDIQQQKKNWHRPMLEFETWIFKSIQWINSRTRKFKLISVMFLLTTLTFTWYCTKVYQIIIYW